MLSKSTMTAAVFLLIGCFIFGGVIETAVEVGTDSNQFPSNWIFHSREKKPGKAFADGLAPEFYVSSSIIYYLLSLDKLTSAYLPEFLKLSGTSASKAAGKPRKQALKRKRGKAKDNDEDEEEEGAGNEPTMVKTKDDSVSGEDDQYPKEKAGKVKNRASNKRAKAAKTSKQAVGSQNGKKPKRAK
ncbi:hypothetical protein F3Y22_tig00110676pilonHSYRG00104 [Hibiscus syriacus]|uniref:Formamidopyrimidine-DNA glycosylase-like C-terminal domain-containing protein n=1 Tax=Hibiscus syriacus TaxID=106335 RepID=A0A6A2ZY52_HIBSY|nr:hypothetical protein F3Y22_tig00110676pilonHSYRG00104 [Hibiscus syriacus]